MAKKSNKITSIWRFLKTCWELTEEWRQPTRKDEKGFLWWRGQPCAADRLLPGLYRYRRSAPRASRALGYEHDAFLEFQRLGGAYIHPTPSTDMGWYTLMRHHGAVTRHLDWSLSALVALRLALPHPGADCDCDAAVWVLDPVWLNETALGIPKILSEEDEEVAPYAPTEFYPSTKTGDARQRPIALYPSAVSPRIVAQKSVFTIHGGNPDSLDEQFGTWDDRNNGWQDSRLRKLVIPHDAKARIRSQLITPVGISNSTIFPDLDGLAKELNDDLGLVW